MARLRSCQHEALRPVTRPSRNDFRRCYRRPHSRVTDESCLLARKDRINCGLPPLGEQSGLHTAIHSEPLTGSQSGGIESLTVNVKKLFWFRHLVTASP